MIEKVIEQIYQANTKDELLGAVTKFLSYYPDLILNSSLPLAELAEFAAGQGYLSQAKILRQAEYRLAFIKQQPEPQPAKAKAAAG